VRRIVAANGIVRHPDVESLLIGSEDSLANAAVKVNAGHDQRIDSTGRQHGRKRAAGKCAEESLMNYRLGSFGTQRGGGRVPGRSILADPFAQTFPVRHPLIVGARDCGPNMRNRNARCATALQQHCGPIHNLAGGRFKSRGAQVIMLEIHQQQEGIHAGDFVADRRGVDRCLVTVTLRPLVPRAAPNAHACLVHGFERRWRR